MAGTRPAFPDFERFYAGDFPPGTPIEVCCVYQFRHVRANQVNGITLTENSGREAVTGVEARVGIEPAYTALQAAA